MIQEAYVGGFIYYNWANGLKNPSQVQALSKNLQSTVLYNPHAIPLFIAIDQEGGVVTRLTQGFTIFPGNGALGAIGDPNLVYQSAFTMGKEMHAVGINLNFAPVVDVTPNPYSPIGIRSFGKNPERVSLYAKHAIQGFHNGGVLSTLKHFPGHGDVKLDSHFDLPIVDKSKEELLQSELIPYRNLVSDADMIMTAHILLPKIDPENCATLSKPILHDLLRNELNYKGIILTDSLVMTAIEKNSSSIEEAALQALLSGCDLLLLGGRLLLSSDEKKELSPDDVVKIHRYLVNAVDKGYLPEKKIDESVERILLAKSKIKAQDTSPLKLEEATALAKEIAKSAIQIKKNLPEHFSLTDKKVLFIGPEFILSHLEKTALYQIINEKKFCSFEKNGQEIKSAAANANVLFIFSYNSWKFPAQKKSIEELLLLHKKTSFIIALGSPEDLDFFSQGEVQIATLSPTAISIQALSNILFIETCLPSLQDENAMERIGYQVWDNECKRSISGLTHWGKEENFPSLGIAHFIWYPEGVEKRFQETFPSFVQFLKKRNVLLPDWLENCVGSPWKNREEFYANEHDSKLKELRQLLTDTMDLQVEFIFHRFQKLLPNLTKNLQNEEEVHVLKTIYTLCKSQSGLYALIDYLNFKGDGTTEKEQYQGKGWGLLQVLTSIPPDSTNPSEDFVVSAEKLLRQRVALSPKERNEEKWLAGWIKRIHTYNQLD